MHDLSLRQNSEKASTMYRRCAIRQPLMDIDRKMGTSMNNKHTDAAEHHAAKRHWLNSHESGYHKAMGNRQVQMIAIGGAIGTGLFLGAGARLQMAGPALALVYLVCGIFSFFILRALGELVLHRPSSGSFVSYAREFLGEKAAYVAGWMYFVNWAMTGIVDITAVALYMHYWGAFGDVPQWVFALGALAIVGTMNMIGVKWFAEMEFWFALVKVLAIVAFWLSARFSSVPANRWMAMPPASI